MLISNEAKEVMLTLREEVESSGTFLPAACLLMIFCQSMILFLIPACLPFSELLAPEVALIGQKYTALDTRRPGFGCRLKSHLETV